MIEQDDENDDSDGTEGADDAYDSVPPDLVRRTGARYAAASGPTPTSRIGDARQREPRVDSLSEVLSGGVGDAFVEF